MLLLFGVDPLLAWECDDPVKMLALEAAVDVATELDEERRQDTVVRFANAIGRVMSSG